MSKEHNKKLSLAHQNQKWSGEQREKIMKIKNERAFPITEEFLLKNYVDKRLKASDCAKILGCSKAHIIYKLRQYKIPRNPDYHIKFSVPKDILYDLYVTQGKSKAQCGRILGCSSVSIGNHLEKHGIAIRPRKALAISKETLFDLYINQRKTCNDCASLLKTSVCNIYFHIKKYNIKTRFEGSRGKVILPSTRAKLRMNTVKRTQKLLEETGKIIFPFFNKNACVFFGYLNKNFGLNGKHALNGGEFHLKELGYWLDFYDPDLNIVIEWNEHQHYTNKKILNKDIIRTQEIKKHLNCTLFIIDERKLKDKRDFKSIIDINADLKNFLINHKLQNPKTQENNMDTNMLTYDNIAKLIDVNTDNLKDHCAPYMSDLKSKLGIENIIQVGV